MPYLTLTENPNATTESWFSYLLWHLARNYQSVNKYAHTAHKTAYK